MVAGACLDGSDVKRELGCYFTWGDPFGSHPAVLRAIRNLPNAPRIVEPCAGMGHLAATFLTKVPGARFELFDLIPRAAADGGDRHVQGAGAAVGRDREAVAVPGGELLLEAPAIRPVGVDLALQRSHDVLAVGVGNGRPRLHQDLGYSFGASKNG